MKNRILSVLLCLVVLFTAAPSVYAIDPIQLDKDVSLAINYVDGDIPLSGITFSLYRIADTSNFADFTLTEQFADYPVSVESQGAESWNRQAYTLKSYIIADNLQPLDTSVTDENGTASFPNTVEKLQPGLYLAIGDSHLVPATPEDAKDYFYTPSPVIISLPNREADSDIWDYDVTANVKFTKDEKDVDFDDYHVIKKWSDYGMSSWRPKEIYVTLLCNGEACDKVTLTADNNWRYKWTNLRTDCEWLVVEDKVKDYTTKISQDGVIFTITNTTTKSPPPQLPHTGQYWRPVYILLSAGLLLVIAGLIRRGGSQNE